MKVATTPADLRRHLGNAADIAFVPTMGALHEGHLTLVKEAQKHTAAVVVSIFVNPLQFGVNEDFSRYPRTLENDSTLLEAAGVTALYIPATDIMYPAGFATSIRLADHLTGVLCGAHRPGHFDGVATVVCKLFRQVWPAMAFFGEKDYQQLCIIRRMATDLDLGVAVHGVATVRAPDGLALSSRNRYLSPEQRQQAALISQVLQQTTAALRVTPQAWPDIMESSTQQLLQGGFRAVDYLELRHQHTLSLPPQQTDDYPLRDYRLFVAARMGETRLIDNMPL
jgi:pantoate--beta-alanine ligase